MTHHAELIPGTKPIIGERLWGRIYRDKSTHGYHPFRDGTLVHITDVQKVEGDLVTTRNTVYKVIANVPS